MNEIVFWTTIIGVITTNVAMLIQRYFDKRTELEKAKVLWEMEVRKGQTQAIVQGIATKNSPFRALPGVLDIFDEAGLTAQLQAWYAEHGKGKQIWELRKLLEVEFGAAMLKLVSEKNGWQHSAVMALALGIAMGPDFIDVFYAEADAAYKNYEAKYKEAQAAQKKFEAEAKDKEDVPPVIGHEKL